MSMRLSLMGLPASSVSSCASRSVSRRTAEARARSDFERLSTEEVAAQAEQETSDAFATAASTSEVVQSGISENTLPSRGECTAKEVTKRLGRPPRTLTIAEQSAVRQNRESITTERL